MKDYGYIRVGALVPHLHLGNPLENAKVIINQAKQAEQQEVAILLTPELSLTGYTCGDMFLQDQLLHDTTSALKQIIKETKKFIIRPTNFYKQSIIKLCCSHSKRKNIRINTQNIYS